MDKDDAHHQSGAADNGRVRVVELTGIQTHDLRRRVLRDGTPSSDVVWAGDELQSSVHLGVVIGTSTTPVAISTWLRQRSPDVEHGVGVQLRGMATEPSLRGHGVGAVLLRSGLARAEHDGADHAWANARSNVLGFYRAHGFAVTSDEFLSPGTAIAHRRILRSLQRA